MTRELHRLSRTQQRAVEDAILTQKADFETRPQAWSQACATITRLAGFPVTESNLRTAFLVLNVKFKAQGTSPFSNLSENNRRITNLEARVAYLEKQLGLPSAIVEGAGQAGRLSNYKD